MEVTRYKRNLPDGRLFGDIIGCKTCAKDENVKYSEVYDTYYCFTCLDWTEPKCDCGECPFPERPEKPSLTTK